MKWFKRDSENGQIVTPKEQTRLSPPVATITLLRESLATPEIQPVDAHLQRLAKYNSEALHKVIETSDNNRIVAQVNKVSAEGFRYIVKGNIIHRFKYIAGINNPLEINEDAKRYTLSYTGDIPEFALNRIDKFIELLKYESWTKLIVKPFISIHSNMPLPVKKLDLKKIDPVIIGWLDITVDDWGFDFYPKIKDENTGVILAVWDNDKELEL